MSFLSIAPELPDGAGVVDTHLHSQERTDSMDECRDLVATSGLVFQSLFLKAPYYVPRETDNPFLEAIVALSREQQWSLMERVNPRDRCHFFLAWRRERPREQFVIDFAGDDALTHVPSLRKGRRVEWMRRGPSPGSSNT